MSLLNAVLINSQCNVMIAVKLRKFSPPLLLLKTDFPAFLESYRASEAIARVCLMQHASSVLEIVSLVLHYVSRPCLCVCGVCVCGENVIYAHLWKISIWINIRLMCVISTRERDTTTGVDGLELGGDGIRGGD